MNFSRKLSMFKATQNNWKKRRLILLVLRLHTASNLSTLPFFGSLSKSWMSMSWHSGMTCLHHKLQQQKKEAENTVVAPLHISLPQEWGLPGSGSALRAETMTELPLFFLAKVAESWKCLKDIIKIIVRSIQNIFFVFSFLACTMTPRDAPAPSRWLQRWPRNAGMHWPRCWSLRANMEKSRSK